MMRKKGKLAGPVIECAYQTEYSKEVLTIPCTAVKKGDRVVIFDDLMATGGTTIAAANLIVQSGELSKNAVLLLRFHFLRGGRSSETHFHN